MVRRFVTFVSILWAFIAVVAVATQPAMADTRVALVIGNSAYRNVVRLPNPANDAAAMGDLFKAAGFDDVQVANDLGVNDLRKALRSFAEKAATADIAVVYYAGHGLEIGGHNYLIPVDAVLARDLDVSDETVDLDRVLELVDQAKRLKLVILDACRDNPFAAKMKRTLGSRAIGRGLGQPEVQTSDTLVAYAARAGSTALDGEGAHSPFATALLHHLTAPGLDLRIALGKVRDEVWQNTRHEQEPFIYGAVGGDTLALVPAKAEPPRAPDTPAADIEKRDFDVAKQMGTLAAWDAFLAHHPSGFLADLAKVERQKLAAAPASPPQQRESLFALPNDARVTWRGDTVAGAFAIAFSPDGTRIATGNPDHTVRLWDVTSGAFLRTLEGHGKWVFSVAFSPDGKTIASASDDQTVKLWQADSGRLVATLEGHSGLRCVAFAPDGRTIAAGGTDGSIMLWDAASGTLLRAIKGHGRWVYSIAFSRDGRLAFASDAINVWDEAGLSLTSFGARGAGIDVYSVAFSPDGRSIAAGYADESIELWSVDGGSRLRTFKRSAKIIPYHTVNLVQSLAFSPDGRVIASASANEDSVKLWDAASGVLVGSLQADGSGVNSVAYSPNGTRIAVSGVDLTVKLWKSANHALLATLFANGADWAAVAANGHYVASGDIGEFLAIKRGDEVLPMDDFIRLNRRDSLADVLAGTR
jgi:WD40 repeat protein